MTAGTVSTPAIATVRIGSLEGAPLRLVWGHGWGQSSAAMMPIAESLKPFAPSLLLDFPGFGNSAPPETAWGTAEYADAVAGLLRTFAAQRTVWLGHSFGGRVGIQLAARHAELLSGLVLIASAGLPRRRTFLEQLRFNWRRSSYRIAHMVVRSGPALDRLRNRFGSADYRMAGAMRSILTRVVSENLTEVARRVQCPALLLYGANDVDTPPDIGQRLRALIPNSQFAVLDNFDHLSILSAGRHQAALRIRRFLEQLPS